MSRVKKVWRYISRKPEGFFLVTSIVFGGLFMVLIPPLQTPDEEAHFIRAYQVSQLDFVASTHNGVAGAYIPKSIGTTFKLLNEPSISFHPELKYNIHKTKAALHIPLNKYDKTFEGGTAEGYSPIPYIPQAVGIFIGTLFNLPTVALIYIARFAVLVAWVSLMFASIKIIPYRKWTLAGLALLPMLVAGSISPGIDGVSIGLGVLFIVSVLHLNRKTKISTGWWLELVIVACLVALSKQTTILVVGLIFLLQTRQFDYVRWKAILKKTIVVVLPLVLILVWSKFGAPHLPNDVSAGQVSGLIHNPLRLPLVIFNTFFFQWGNGAVESFIGDFGWVDTPMSGGLISLGYVFIAFLLFTNYERVRPTISKLGAWLTVVLTGLYIVGTCAALYIVYSPLHYPIIYGLQGRYFLLMLFMLLPLVMSVPVKISQKHYTNVLIITSLVFLVAGALTIFFRYYLNYF